MNLSPEVIERIQALHRVIAIMRASNPSARLSVASNIGSTPSRPRLFVRVKGKRSMSLKHRSAKRKARR